ncbi:hypothetical protein [Oryzihumus leptocrescens]|uniref:Uncharacterized protein n=1 Tax=Oryzihumus leptocrescens TaxID=297536 RepID=A0A542ZKQ6_9MICO|nr:hypothetical protein [Oryzihumus leptocrescens]TQL60931.1 hypothetical protein FB474_2331 [Oryzihumus leptocrescens]
MRLTSLCAAAALAGLASLAVPAAALAAPHATQARHVQGKASSHGHAATRSHGHGKADPLAGQRKGTTAAIAAQTRSLTRLLAAEKASTALNATDQAALTAATQRALDALAADTAAAGTTTTRSGLHGLVLSAVRTSEVARAQDAVVRLADAQEAAPAALTQAATDLQAQVVAGTTAGTDTTAATAALADLATQLTALSANAANAAGAVTTILAVSPTASHADLLAAVQAAHTALAPGNLALARAKADVAVVKDALGH